MIHQTAGPTTIRVGRCRMSGPSTGGAFDSIEAFVSTAEGVVATGQELDEANTKAKILTPLVRTLGWPVHDNTEVLLEYSGEDQFEDKVDYALFDADELYAVIEAKQIGESLSEHTSQIRRYMRLYGAEWGLLTNGENYQIFRSEDEADEKSVERLSLADLSTSEYLQQLSRDSARGEVEAPEPVNKLSEAKKTGNRRTLERTRPLRADGWVHRTVGVRV